MPKKVIFVDDSKTVLATVEYAVSELIEDGTIEFSTYLNPVEFLAKVKEGSVTYDLLFTDINMPQMTGLDLSRELKAIDALKQRPIVALTTESSADIKKLGKEIGIAGWLVKPFSDEKVVVAIKKVLGV